MKKVLIALGIGCGVLLIGGVIAMAVLGYACKKSLGGMADWGKKFSAQQEKIKALDAQYSFNAPPEGQLLKLDEARLQSYMEIRKQVWAVFKEFEAKSKSFDTRTQDGKKAGFGDAMEAAKMLGDLTYKVRDTFITGLEAKKMSPREFHTITGAIYSTAINRAGMDMKAGQEKATADMAQQRSEIETKLNDPATSESDKAMLKAQLEAMEAQEKMAAGMSGMANADPATVTANEALIAKYKSDVDTYANPALDAFLADENMGKGFMQMK